MRAPGFGKGCPGETADGAGYFTPAGKSGEAAGADLYGLLELAERFKDILIVFPVHLSPAVRDVVLPRLRQHDRIVLLEPIDYFDTVHFMKASHLILTDSGGIQEEAPALGKPVLVLRDVTERPEGVTAGTVRLVGTDASNIVEAVSELLSDSASYRRMAEAVNPYGDGLASERILQALEFLAGRGPSPKPFDCASVPFDKAMG